jgi:hypothetical protein
MLEHAVHAVTTVSGVSRPCHDRLKEDTDGFSLLGGFDEVLVWGRSQEGCVLCSVTVRSSFPGVDRPGCGDDHPPPSSYEVANGLDCTFAYPLPAPACHGAAFTFTPSDARQTP